ncbi:Uncharacterised protein [Vibrio cholerae]|nr:Uncharacterised protein [Vibrio cholerae]
MVHLLVPNTNKPFAVFQLIKLTRELGRPSLQIVGTDWQGNICRFHTCRIKCSQANTVSDFNRAKPLWYVVTQSGELNRIGRVGRIWWRGSAAKGDVTAVIKAFTTCIYPLPARVKNRIATAILWQGDFKTVFLITSRGHIVRAANQFQVIPRQWLGVVVSRFT